MKSNGLQQQIVIAVCTHSRVEKLTNLIPEIVSQANQLNVAWKILIVDNDPKRSASSLNFESSKIFVRHAVPEGVGAARNIALNSAMPGESVIFFDDDQFPQRGWLKSMILASNEHPNSIIVGPVTPKFEVEAPKWGQGWAWGERRANYIDGQNRTTAGFGNVLIPAVLAVNPIFRAHGAFLVGPGEDTYLSFIARHLGHTIIYSASAHAVEFVGAERLSKRWVLLRNFKDGITWARLARLQGKFTSYVAVGSALKAFSRGIYFLFVTRKVSRGYARFQAEVCLGAGIFFGLVSSITLKPPRHHCELVSFQRTHSSHECCQQMKHKSSVPSTDSSTRY